MPKLFFPRMKLAVMLKSNPSLIPMLPRFGIALGFGEKSIEEVCSKYGVAVDFFLLICNVYTHSEYIPKNDELFEIDMTGLIPYLQASHKYYRQEQIPVLEQKLASIVAVCEPNSARMLQRFFDEYRGEVFNHFDYEENVVFPYIQDLYRFKKVETYDINQFEKNHSNIEDKLNELISILIKYIPENVAQQERIDALNSIFTLVSDLNKHSLIEDKILVPYVEKIEQNGKR